MSLDMTPVHRNLHTKVTFLGLEFEDLILVLALAAVMNLLAHFVSGNAHVFGMTSAQAQAFKRAASCYGLGRYLYNFREMWVSLDDRKQPIQLHAHLRRRERDLGLAAKAERRIPIGRFTLDRKARVLLADEKPVTLASREMKLLEKLASSPSRVFSPDEILDEVWGNHLRRSLPALSGLLRRLRRKMANNGLPDPIENVRGRGFRLLESIRLNSEPRAIASYFVTGGVAVKCPNHAPKTFDDVNLTEESGLDRHQTDTTASRN